VGVDGVNFEREEKVFCARLHYIEKVYLLRKPKF
jgi:hypothetical protein